MTWRWCRWINSFESIPTGPRAIRYPPIMRRRYGHIHTWGTTAQGVYKAGDTIQYKLYVRDQNNETFVPAPGEGYTLNVIDPTGKIVHTVADIYPYRILVPMTGNLPWPKPAPWAGIAFS